MPKMKTHSGAKKRFKLTASGKVKVGFSFKRHGMRKRPNKMLSSTRGMKVLHASDATKVVKEYLLNDR